MDSVMADFILFYFILFYAFKYISRIEDP